MQNSEFLQNAEKILLHIANTIEEQDHEGLIDVDLNNNILNVTTEYGVFVVNIHSATKQIWLSSPISGPYHFSYIGDRWCSAGHVDLLQTLANELRINFDN